jgi:phage terminase small subunit
MPAHEPKYETGVPDQPKGMSAGAKRVWDYLVVEMMTLGTLRRIDGYALAQLCEDEAMLQDLREGLAAKMRDMTAQAKKDKKPLSGNAAVEFSLTTAGRRVHRSIREAAAQIIVQRREFGLTPSSSGRVEAIGLPDAVRRVTDPLEMKLCS